MKPITKKVKQPTAKQMATIPAMTPANDKKFGVGKKTPKKK